jgi:nucleotidyltransferase substrate binding protein (TIGR01987 family)
MNSIEKLDVSSFRNAVASLEEALTEHHKDTDNRLIRDATIQRFEYTYELSHTMLKRYLEISEASAQNVDQMSFSNLIRTGSERGLLLNGWASWKQYRDARNMTSHTYDEDKAIQVCAIIPQFFSDAQFLLAQLQARILAL